MATDVVKTFREPGQFEPGFPVRPKEIDPDTKGVVCLEGTVKFKYWTNFSRQRSQDFEVLEYDPEIEGYWWFETNLEREDFDFMLTPEAVRRFLYAMADIYRKPKDG
jgi:hypothetical protein